MTMTTDAADHGAATANDRKKNTGKEASPDREQQTDNKETAVMMTPEEIEGWKTYISKKARRTKKKKQREEAMTKREESSDEETKLQQTSSAEEEHPRDHQQNKGKEKRQAKEEKKTKKERRETEKNNHTNDKNEKANNKTEREHQSKHKDGNNPSEKTNNNGEDPEKVDERNNIDYTTESDLFDSDSEFGDKTLDAPETIAVKEAKFYLSIRPRNNSNFDPREMFVAFLQTVQEVDPEAYICPFDKHNQSPILEKAHDIPNTSEALQYIYRMRERRGTWSSVVRVQSEVDDWRLLSAPQMRVFLLHSGMRAVKQELDSPNLANAGWILGLHPRLTSRKDLLNRIEKAIPYKSRVPMELRGHALYMPRGIDNPEDSVRRLRTEALQIYCDVKHVHDLQDMLAKAITPVRNTGEKFIPHAGRLDTHSNGDIQKWVKQQNEVVNRAARQPLRFPMMNGNLDGQYVVQGGMSNTAREWFMAQKEFGPSSGIMQIETEHIKGQGATLVYDRNLRDVARGNMEVMIMRYQKALTDTSREILFDNRYKYTVSGNKLITELVKDARDYQRVKKMRLQRREEYKQEKARKAEVQWWKRNGATQPKISAHYDNRETTKQMNYSAAVMGKSTPREAVTFVTQESEEGEIAEHTHYEQVERSPPKKKSRTEEMMSELNSRMDAMEATAEQAKERVDGLEGIVQQSLSRTIELTKRVQDLSQSVIKIPDNVAKSVNDAMKQSEKKQSDRIDLLEQRENQAAREMAVLGEKMAQLQTELRQAKSETEDARKTCKRIEQQQQKQDKMPKTTEIRHQGRQIAQMHNDMTKLSNSLSATQEEIKTLPNRTMLEDVAEYSADIVIQSMQELLDALDGEFNQFQDAARKYDPEGRDEELNSNTPARKVKALGSIFELKLKDSLLKRCRELGKRMKTEHPIYKDILAVRKAYKQLGQAQEEGKWLETGNGNPPSPATTEGNDDKDSNCGEKTRKKETIPPPSAMLDDSFAIEDMAVALSQLMESDDNIEEPWLQCNPAKPFQEIQNENNTGDESGKRGKSAPTKRQSDGCPAQQKKPTSIRQKPRSSKRLEQKMTAAKAKNKTNPKHTIQTKDSVLTTPKKSSEAGGRHDE